MSAANMTSLCNKQIMAVTRCAFAGTANAGAGMRVVKP